MTIVRIAASLALVTATVPAAAVELIANGGFETGSFTGWTQSGAVGATSVNAASANTGNFGASFSPNAVGGISQTFATVIGTSYTLTFDLAHTLASASPANSFDVVFNANSQLSYANLGALPYTSFSFTEIATAALTTVQFTFRDTRATVYRLDNVSVSALVPEPATWALMIGGFGLVGLAMRRRVVPAA